MSNQIQQSPLYNLWHYSGESIRLLGQTVIAMTEVSGYLCSRQIERAEAATGENSRQLKSLLKKTGETSASLAEWSGVFQGKIQNFAGIAHAWRKVTLDAMAETNELLGSSLSSFSPSGAFIQKQTGKAQKLAPKPVQKTADKAAEAPPIERRFLATMIAFPDRRTAAMMARSNSTTHDTARARRSA